MTKHTTYLGSIAVIFVLILCALPVHAQQAHHIAVENAFFEPDSLAIEPGDTVIWTNTSGFHNVNGTQEAYPSNPESFGNSTGRDWTYSFVFTTPGTYNYHCDPHQSLGMTGKIMVVEDSVPTQVQSPVAGKKIHLYPNPATDDVHITGSHFTGNVLKIRITNMNGRVVQSKQLNHATSTIRLDVSQFSDGIYFIEIRSDGYTAQAKFSIVR